MTDFSTYLLAVDIGGTFTDLVLLDKQNYTVAVGKLLTTYPDPSEAVLAGTTDLLAKQEIAPTQIERVIHGTTLVTNTLIERRGVTTALLTTRGFRDAVEIGNEGRYDLYDLGLIKPTPLVERRLRLEVDERMTARGEIYTPLDEESVRARCKQMAAEGVEAVAICFLHAYANNAHELRAREIVHEMMPGVPVSLSHQVAPAMREYPRTSTTVANAYVQPLTQTYMQRLQAGLVSAGVTAPLNIMLSNGGTCRVETAVAFPIRLVESGPAGGALAGAYWAEKLGYDDVFAFDMGGTTAKAIVSEKGAFAITTESEVAHVHRFKKGSGLPLLVPMIHMIEIGAGGGSIARLNQLGLPAVGPQSAGSTPGPACYGLGGQLPTVTDADLLLGHLNGDYFANGTMTLDRDAAMQAFGDLARVLELAPGRVAWGIHQLVNENMASAARVHSAERGLDIRQYAMVATGGAGPVHACGVAEKIGLDTVIIPPIAGVGSAFGFMQAPISFDFTRSYLTQLDGIDHAELNSILDSLEREGREIVQSAGVAEDEITLTRSVDMRYLRQGYEIRVHFGSGEVNDALLAEIQCNFEAEYIKFYGRLCEGVPIQAVNWRVVVSGPKLAIETIRLAQAEASAKNNGAVASRPVLFNPEKGAVDTSVYHRYSLTSDFVVDGPAIVEEAESTTVIRPGWNVRLDTSGCLVLKRI